MNLSVNILSTSTLPYSMTTISKWPPNSSADNTTLPLKVVLGVVCAITFAIGVPASLLIVYIIAKHNELRTYQNAFVASLAFRDMITLGYAMPVFFVDFILGSYPFGNTVCMIQLCVIFSLGLGSVMELMNVALSRYFKICCHIGAYRSLYTRRNTSVFIILSWTLSFLFGVPISMQYGKLDHKTHVCFIQKSNVKAIITSVTLSTAIAVISFCYFKILRTVRNAKFNLKRFNEGPTQHKRVQQNLQKSLRDFIVFAFFIFLILPFVLLNSFGLSSPRFLAWDIAKLLSFMNNFTNCFIYGILNKQLRFFFCRLLTCRRRSAFRNVVYPFTITVTNNRGQSVLGRETMTKNSVCVRYPNTVIQHCESSNTTICVTGETDVSKL